MTHTIDAARSLALGDVDPGAVAAAVLSALALAVIAAAAMTRAAAARRRP